MEKKNITNLAAQVAANPLLGIAVSTPTGIVASEAAGQRELILSDQLPVDFLHGTDADLEAMGFVLGPPTPGDRLFRQAQLPPGWSKQATGQNLWTDIVDERGRKRLSIGYKAAHYDRWAQMIAEPVVQEDVS